MQTDIGELNEGFRNIEIIGVLFRRLKFNLFSENFEQPKEKVPEAFVVRRTEMHSYPAAIKDPRRLQGEFREVDGDSVGNFINWISFRGIKQID